MSVSNKCKDSYKGTASAGDRMKDLMSDGLPCIDKSDENDLMNFMTLQPSYVVTQLYIRICLVKP